MRRLRARRVAPVRFLARSLINVLPEFSCYDECPIEGDIHHEDKHCPARP